MSVHLLDVNVLLAIIWPTQEAHSKTVLWFLNNHKSGWATCPFTQTAVVRILSNPAFSSQSLSPEEAQETLATHMGHAGHRFWPADLEYAAAVSPFTESIVGHKQISDAYLLGLAIHRRGKFATLDHRIRAMLPEQSRLRDFVVEI